MGKGICSAAALMSYFGGSGYLLLWEKLNSSAFPGPGVAVLWHHKDGYGGNTDDARGRLGASGKTPGGR